ncbi:hypothetical protein L1887_44426 [Cichorium endivia]|nr:hypothetical protein L1887_44426 [Cichorium endivia]
MLVRRDLGFPSLVFLVVVVVVPVIVLIIRRKWRHSVARSEEIKRLVVSASEELARAEFEAREAYYYTATATPSVRVSVPTSASIPTSVSVPLGSPLKPQYQCAVCFCPTTTRCAKCKAVRYCSGKCQIIHWRQGHKYDCRPYVAVSPADDQDQTDSFDTEAQQSERFSENSDHQDVVGSTSFAHQQDTSTSTNSPLSYKGQSGTPTKVSAGENIGTVKSLHQTLGSPARKLTGSGKKNHKRCGTWSSSSSGWTNNESEPCTSTTSSGFWDGTIHNNKSSIAEHDELAPTTKDGYNSNSSDGSGPKDVRGTSKSSPSAVVAFKDDKAFGGLPSSGPDVSTNKSASKSKEEGSSLTTSTGKHISHSTKPVKVNDRVTTSTSSQLTESCRVRSGSKTSKPKPVDQVKPSKSSSLEGGNETAQRYAFKGLFPYDMFVKLYASKKVELQPFGLKNCGNSCYANAVLQCLIYTPPLTAYFLQGLHSRACDKRGWCFTCEVEGLVIKAKDGVSPLSPIRILTHIENIGSNLGHGKEEDAHEFLRYVIDALQSVCIKEAGTNALTSSEEETTLIGLTFGGYLRSKINCIKCGGKSERHERMMDLTVEIEGNIGTLEEALDKFTCAEILDGENKYKCSRCKSYEKARKKLTLLEAPNVLTIALKRFQSGKFGKLNKSIQFPEILDMAPYVSGTSDKSPIYRLYGVVVHVDTHTMNDAFSGHYVCYVKNVQNRWFKFNDSMVNEVDLQHVLTKGAYMLLYARCSPRAPRSIRSSLIHNNDPRKHKTTATFVTRSHSTEPWEACNYHPNSHRHRSLEEESSSSSSDNSGFFSESCSCSTDSTHRDSNTMEDQIPGDWEHDYWNNSSMNMNMSVNSSDSDTSSTSSFPSPLYSRLSHLYTSRTNKENDKECRNLDCSCSSCSRVANLDRVGSKPGVTFRRSTTRGKSD